MALKILGNDIGGRPLLILGVLLIFIGIQFFTTGIIVDMLMKTYYESQEKRPLTSEISQHLEKVNLKKLLINFAKIFISIALLYFVFQKIPFREVTVLWAKRMFLSRDGCYSFWHLKLFLPKDLNSISMPMISI